MEMDWGPCESRVSTSDLSELELMAPSRRIHAVAYDVRTVSAAQPRVRALLTELARRGWTVILWTSTDPGDWANAFEVRVVADVVRSVYRACQAARGPAKHVPATAVEAAVPQLRRQPAWWRAASALQSAVMFPDPETLWSRAVRRQLLRDLFPANDAVMTFSRPESAHRIGAAAKRKAGACWWADFADGWCFQGLRADAMLPGRRRDRELVLEREVVRAADKVSTVMPEHAAYFDDLRGPGADRTVLLPNVVPEELWVETAKSGVDPSAPIRLGYFGRLSGSDRERSLHPFVDLMARPGVEQPAAVSFVGTYDEVDRVEIAALEAAGVRCDVNEPVPRAALVGFAETVDAALVIGSPRIDGTSSKLLDTIGLQLPVFALAPAGSQMEALVRETGCGIAAALGADAVPAWSEFVRGVRAGAYRVDRAVRDRYRAAAVVPGICERLEDSMLLVQHRLHVR